MGFDVFIVHAAPDKDTALRLRDALERVGVRAFVDKPDTPPGALWDATIDRALRTSLLQVVLLGEGTRWYQSEEIDIAIKEMRAHGADDRVVPVLLTLQPPSPKGQTSRAGCVATSTSRGSTPMSAVAIDAPPPSTTS